MAKQNSGKGKGVGTGMAIAGAALAAAAAGYYFYASDDAKKHRAKAAKWAGGFKKEVVKQAKSMGAKMDQKTLAAAIDRAAALYAGAKKVSGIEVAAAAKELKKHWRDLALEVGGAKKMVRTGGARKTVKKSAKKRGR